MSPERIAVIGRSGGGKSTLTRALSARLGLPMAHLDVLFWRPGWVESDHASFRERLAAALSGGRWVSAGNFTSAGDLHLAGAELIVWVDQPRLVCLWRAIWRVVTDRGGKRTDMAEGCDEKWDPKFYAYIWNWDRDTRPKMQAALELYAPGTPVVVLRSDKEIAAFVGRFDPPLHGLRDSHNCVGCCE